MQTFMRIPLLFLALFIVNVSFAVVAPVSNEKTPITKVHDLVEEVYPSGAALTAKQKRKKARLKKVVAKFEKRITKINAKRAAKGKPQIDFSDPVDKWMWFWIFAWGGALVLSILAAACFLLYSG